MKQQYLMGVDIGTTGVKACVFDLEGNVVGSAYQEYPCYYPKPTWVEQTPEDMVPATFSVLRLAIERSGVNNGDILALGMSTQGSVIALMDKDDNLIRPFVSWQDIRGGNAMIDKLCKEIPRKEFYRITGDPLGLLFSVTKLMWLNENEPENMKRCAHVLDQQDYFLRLFGADGYYTDTATASRNGMLDIDNLCWSEELHKIVGLPLSKRSEIIKEPGKILARVPKHIAEQTGLKEGTPVCLCSFDQNCNTFGSGGIKDGTAVMVMGTFGSCFVVSDKSVRDPQGVLVVKPNQGIGNYTIEACSNTCASSYRWYRDTFGDFEKLKAAENGRDPYDLINEQIATVPPGSNGVTFLNYLQGASGAKINDRARATFLGMTIGTTKADMARAVMEGICFEMNDIIKAEQAAGIQLNGIRLTGGAAKSPLWCQMLSDITKQPIYLLKSGETGCLGAALYAGVGVGVYQNCADASDRAVQLTSSYAPNPETFDAYDKAYQRFDDIYNALDGTIF